MAEDRAADPHMGRAQRDRRLEIAAHPHRQLGQAVIARQFGEQREMERRFRILRRNA